MKRLVRGRIFVDHTLDPLPHFLTTSSKEKNNLQDEAPASVMKGKNIFQEGRYIFIMSRTSLIILATFLLILSVVCFMAGFLISKSLHEKESERHLPASHPIIAAQAPAAIAPTIDTTPASKLQVHEEVAAFNALHAASPAPVNKSTATLAHVVSQEPKAPASLSAAQQKYHQLVGLHKDTHVPSAPTAHMSPQTGHPLLQPAQKPIHPSSQGSPHTPSSAPIAQPSSPHAAIPQIQQPYHYDTNSYGAETQRAQKLAFLNAETYASHPHTMSPLTFQQFEDQTHPLHSALAPQEYGVQIGSFQDLEAAQQLHQELKNRGYDAKVYKGWDGRQQTWYHVRIGQFTSQDQANTVAFHFLNKERTQANVMAVSPQETRVL